MCWPGLSAPTIATLAPFPYSFKWHFTYLNFISDPLFVKRREYYQLPTRTKISLVGIVSTVVWAGPALTVIKGSITDDVNDEEKYMPFQNLMGTGNGFEGFDGGVTVPHINADHSTMFLVVRCEGANLQALTGGELDLYMELSRLPTVNQINNP